MAPVLAWTEKMFSHLGPILERQLRGRSLLHKLNGESRENDNPRSDGGSLDLVNLIKR